MTISEAIVELRKALSLTQQAFASKLNISMSAVHYYEQAGRIPEPGILVKFKQAAEYADKHELAAVFRDQLHKGIGVPDSWKGVLPIEPKTDKEKILTAGLLAVCRNPIFSAIEPHLVDVLQVPCLKVSEKIRKHQQQVQLNTFLEKYIQDAIDSGKGYWDDDAKKFKAYQEGDEVQTSTAPILVIRTSATPNSQASVPLDEAERDLIRHALDLYGTYERTQQRDDQSIRHLMDRIAPPKNREEEPQAKQA